jgi:hypothetical protein
LLGIKPEINIAGGSESALRIEPSDWPSLQKNDSDLGLLKCL